MQEVEVIIAPLAVMEFGSTLQKIETCLGIKLVRPDTNIIKMVMVVIMTIIKCHRTLNINVPLFYQFEASIASLKYTISLTKIKLSIK